jgi:hypothetical protein
MRPFASQGWVRFAHFSDGYEGDMHGIVREWPKHTALLSF